MTEPTEEFRVERVLAVLDVGCCGIETIATAAETAARLGAELTGLFIEDRNLFRLAALPVARQINLYGATAAALDSSGLEAELKALAGRAEASLASIAGRLGLRWSFRTTRGDPAAEILAAAAAADLLVVSAAVALPGVQSVMRSPLGAAARRTQRPVLLLPPRPSMRRPLAIARDVSAHTARTLAAAARLGTESRELDVLFTAAANELARELEAWASDWLVQRGLRARFHRIGATGLARLAEAIRLAGGDLLVVSADTPPLDEDDGGEAFVARTGRPVLVVR